MSKLLLSMIATVALFGCGKSSPAPDVISTNSTGNDRVKHEFIYLGGRSFKTVGSETVFADDCIGCGEIGNVSVYRNTENQPDRTNYIVDAQCGDDNRHLVERTDHRNEFDTKVGVRCLVATDKSAHIFWTEGTEYWFINAPTLEIAKDFEASPVFRLWKSKEKSSEQ